MDVILTIFEFIAFYYGALILSGQLRIGKSEGLSLIGLAIFSGLALSSFGVYTQLFCLLLLLIMRFYFTRELKKSFVFVVLALIIGQAIAYVEGYYFSLYCTIYCPDVNYYLYYIFDFFIWLFLYFIICYLVLLAWRRVAPHILKDKAYNYLLIVFCTGFMFLWAYFYHWETSDSLDGIEILGIPIMVAILFIALILFVWILSYQNQQSKQEQAEREAQAMKFYAEAIEDQYESERAFKHDNKNMILSFEAYFENQDWEGLTSYFYEEVLPASSQLFLRDFDLDRLQGLKIPALKSLLIHKYSQAQALGIPFSIEMMGEIDTIDMNLLDLVRIMGILIDNALEEVQAMGKGKVVVSLMKNGPEVILMVSNSCRSASISIKSLNQRGYTTKETGQGLGLYNVQEIKKGYSNVDLETKIEGHQFIQTLIINPTEK